MPRRPLPSIPRGPRRSRASRPSDQLLACPRISPEWELSALQALIKPQLKGTILHRTGKQRWTRSNKLALSKALAILQDRLGSEFAVHLPVAGDFHFISNVTGASPDEARAFAAVLSKAMPQLWIVAGRLLVKDGRFYRRQYGYKLAIVPATDIHLPRALRAALKDCL